LGLVITADHMANHVQRGDALDEYDATLNPGMPVLAQKWSKERVAWFIARVPGLLHEVAHQDAAGSGSTRPTPTPTGPPRPANTPAAHEKPASGSGAWKRISSWF
jgi:hypothetical protein